MIYVVVYYETDILVGQYTSANAVAWNLHPGTQFGKGETLIDALAHAMTATKRWREARAKLDAAGARRGPFPSVEAPARPPVRELLL